MNLAYQYMAFFFTFSLTLNKAFSIQYSVVDSVIWIQDWILLQRDTHPTLF